MEKTPVKIRQVKESERELIAEIYNNSYRIGREKALQWAQAAKLANTRAIFEKGHIVSMLQIIPYQVYIGGKIVPMGGIGGVATRADCQRKGYASALMRDSVKQMKGRGLWVSILFPFSYAYYRKFGWELCGHRYVYREFAQDKVIPFEEKELVRFCEGKKEIPILAKVYTDFAKYQYNLCVMRTKETWLKKITELQNNRAQIYYVEDKNQPIGYFICSDKPLEYGYETVIREYACLNETAYKAMFGFLSQLPTNVAKITLYAPYSPLLWKYFKEPFYPKTSMEPALQFRVVDVKKSLEMRGYPEEANGKVIFTLSDDCAQWNCGPWKLELEKGNPKVTQITADEKIDFCCSIQTFSELYCGYRSAEELALVGKLDFKNHSKLDFLNRAFFDKPTYILDFF